MKKLFVFAFCVMCMMSCSESTSENGNIDSENTGEVQSKEDRQVEIQEMEKEISALVKTERTEMLDAKADRLLKRYRDYISLNPRDSITSEYLFKAADLSVGVGKPEAAIAYLDRLHTDFPNFRKTVEMWLFKGFIYENYLNNHAKAVETYKALIEKYPNHRLAKDAQSSIDNLSLTEEELIEKFKKLNPEKEP